MLPVLSVFFIEAAISCCIDAFTLSSMLVSHLPPFLDSYCLSKSSLGSKAICVVTSFLVLWSICWSSSLVHFKNGPDYLTRGTSHVFISLMRFLLCSLVSRIFPILLTYYFFYSFISTGLIVSASNIPRYL